MVNLSKISTEQKNERTEKIDKLSVLETVELINSEDQKVALAVKEVLPEIAKAIDIIYEKMDKGGRLIYCGCGTSGRLGLLDAVECPPTFGIDKHLVQGIIAGGEYAFVEAVEGAEDDKKQGKTDLQNIDFSDKDVLVGIAASGRTPYVLGAMEQAKQVGGGVISLTCTNASPMSKLAEVSIEPLVGAEVITGSTRLKSGTAQKMVLNMLSTTVMIKLGKVYGNLMVDVKATNEKLVSRTISVVMTATGVTEEAAKKALEECDFSAKHAILMILCDISSDDAKKYIIKAKGKISDAIEMVKGDLKWKKSTLE